ncbi:hypothetical protein RHMOL_Rhmol04G0134900 [Rhododendron molle]|uniref:Uncharacterized protein n=1 Tax=Rhododendron molle TaxID=49168 RepID=A0ACC0P198_RHOML|nr:hypothetical protein RHMOL_Rhmol04G0134900 [Rhododendron molle]
MPPSASACWPDGMVWFDGCGDMDRGAPMDLHPWVSFIYSKMIGADGGVDLWWFDPVVASWLWPPWLGCSGRLCVSKSGRLPL